MDITRQAHDYLVVLISVLLFSQCSRADQLPDAIHWIQKGEWTKAETALAQSSSEDAQILYWKAYVLFRTGRFSESVAVIARYLEQRPESAAGRKILGLCYFMQGNAGEAERELKLATESNASDSEALYYLGRIYFTRHDLRDALQTFEKLVVLEKASVRGYNHLGQTYEALSQFESARAAYQKAIEIEQAQPAKSEWPYFNLGVLYLKEGRPLEAIDLLGQAIARRAAWPEAKIQMAVALFSSGRYEDAQVLLREVLQNDPKNADAHYQMGRLLLKLGKPEQARPHLEHFESLKRQQ